MLRWLVSSRYVVLGLVVVLAAASVGLAQGRGGRGGPGGRFGFGGPPGGPGGPGGRGMGPGMLLRNEKVQTELALSDEQKSSIEAAIEKSMENNRDFFGSLRDLSDEERRAKMDEFRAKAEEANKELMALLNEDQQKRLNQISLQLRGVDALLDDEYAGKLGLSDDQKQQIRDLLETQREMQREMFAGLRDLSDEERRAKFEEMGKAQEELRKETDSAAVELLTDAQKAQWNDLLGKPFEIDRASLFGGFGRGGRGGPPGFGPGGPGGPGRGGRGGRGPRGGGNNDA